MDMENDRSKTILMAIWIKQLLWRYKTILMDKKQFYGDMDKTIVMAIRVKQLLWRYG